MNEDDAIISAEFLVNALNRKIKVQRRYWVRCILKSREKYSGTDILQDLRFEDPKGFQTFIRMSSSDFEELMNNICPKSVKKDTNYRGRSCTSSRTNGANIAFSSNGGFVSQPDVRRVAGKSVWGPTFLFEGRGGAQMHVTPPPPRKLCPFLPCAEPVGLKT